MYRSSSNQFLSPPGQHPNLLTNHNHWSQHKSTAAFFNYIFVTDCQNRNDDGYEV